MVWLKWESTCFANPEFKPQSHKRRRREGGRGGTHEHVYQKKAPLEMKFSLK
jgi:hypothetical protein